MSRAHADGTTRPELPLTEEERELLAQLLTKALLEALATGGLERAR